MRPSAMTWGTSRLRHQSTGCPGSLYSGGGDVKAARCKPHGEMRNRRTSSFLLACARDLSLILASLYAATNVRFIKTPARDPPQSYGKLLRRVKRIAFGLGLFSGFFPQHSAAEHLHSYSRQFSFRESTSTRQTCLKSASISRAICSSLQLSRHIVLSNACRAISDCGIRSSTGSPAGTAK